MTAPAHKPYKKPAVVKVHAQRAAAPARPRMLSGKALLLDMAAYGKQVSATPESARDFLTRLGVLDKHGKRRNLIRG